MNKNSPPPPKPSGYKPPEIDRRKQCMTWPQYHFVTSPAAFPAMIAGYGAGKTEACIMRALRLKRVYPDQNIGYYMPTYDLINLIAYARFESLLHSWGYAFKLNKADKELSIEGMNGKFIFRTMDKPERIVGYEHAHALADELDILPADKAADVWRKIVARNRQKMPDGAINTIGLGTTPEGYRFAYDNWKRKPLKNSQLIKASTFSNRANLPADYIDTLRDNFPERQLAAYLEGEFVNMTSGSVYPEFDRKLNHCDTQIQTGETLHIGVDFNVGEMAAAVHVMRDNEIHAVSEHVKLLDTPAMVRQLVKYKSDGHRIIVYPDASGANRKTTNASSSDIDLLREAGFFVMAKKQNPLVKNRVATVNNLIHKNGKRRYKVNSNACPHLVECIEKQAYDKNGQPDKTSGFDHLNDAVGYFISYRFPIVYGRAIQTNVKGL